MPLYRSPLLQFAVIGLVLFGLWHWQNQGAAGEKIFISAAQIEHLASQYERTFLRPPEPDELKELIKDEVRSELALREAKRLSLQTDDTIIKRRMRQKIEFLAQEVNTVERISDVELSDFYEKNKKNYRRETELEFAQLFIDPQRHPEGAVIRSAEIRQALAEGRNPASLTDPLLLPMQQKPRPISKVEATFGKQFANSLLKSEDSGWFGPVESAFGWHLVRIDSRHPARIPPFAEIANQLRNDLLSQKRADALDSLYERLEANYPVTVEAWNGTPADTQSGFLQ